MRTVKVVFGVPTEGYTQCEALQSLMMMCFHHGKLEAESRNGGHDIQWEFYHATAGRMFTPMAREKLADTALRIGADFLFMIDDDMLAPHDLFDKLVRHNVDVVAPLAFTRNPPFLPVLYRSREGWDEQLHRKYFLTDWIRNYPRGKLVECDAVGFGSVLIRTSLLRKMKPPFFMCSSGTGEDIWFCLQAKRQAGAKIFMDTSVELGHLGSPIVVDSRLNEEHNDPVKMERLYGPYKKYGVYEVSHFSAAETARVNGKLETEVLAL